jgi:hypothetical protein
MLSLEDANKHTYGHVHGFAPVVIGQRIAHRPVYSGYEKRNPKAG